MPSIYQLKPHFQALLRPLVQRLYDSGITANQVTLAALVVSLAVAAAVALLIEHLWIFLLIPLWMLLRMALNAIDGMLAREFGQQSKLGAYLNELCDVAADAALYLPLALVTGVWPAAVVLVVVLAALTECDSLILFPEGTRNLEEGLLPFKSGLYRLGLACPDVELVPVWIANLNRVMPKGRSLPLPLLCSVSFGAPMSIEKDEDKDAFLQRARLALLELAPKED